LISFGDLTRKETNPNMTFASTRSWWLSSFVKCRTSSTSIPDVDVSAET